MVIRTRWPRRLVLLALGASFLLPTNANATRGRRDSLVGNLALEDDSDVFIFPGLLARYGYQFDLDLAEQITGTMIFQTSESTVSGVAINRTQPLNNMDGVDDIAVFKKLYASDYGNVPISELGTFVFGLRSGLGFRLSITSAETIQAEKGAETLENGYTVTGVEGAVGLSSRETSVHYDVSAAFRFNSAVVKEGDKEAGATEGPPDLMLGGRLYFGDSDGWSRLAVLANLSYHNYSVKNYEAGAYILRGGAGPVFRVGDRVTLAGLASLGFAAMGEDPKGQDNTKSGLAFAFPGFDMSIDYRVLKWLALRWGYQGRFLVESTTAEGPGSRETSLSTTKAETTWAAGLGLRSWDFLFDMGVQSTDGPTGISSDKVVFSIAYRPSAENLRSRPPEHAVPNDPFRQETPVPVEIRQPDDWVPQPSRPSEPSAPATRPVPPPLESRPSVRPAERSPSPGSDSDGGRDAVERADGLLQRATAAKADLTAPLDFALADQKLAAAKAALAQGRDDEATALANEAAELLAPLAGEP
jgi:hypothetical protein